MLRDPVHRPATGLTGWYDVCRLNEIRPGHARPVLVNGTEIALFRDEDDVFALGGTCPHRGGPLGGGTVVAGRAVCPLHGRQFDLRTGISPHDETCRVPTYRCRVVGGTVQIDADSVPAGPGRTEEYLGRWSRRGASEPRMALIQRLAGGSTRGGDEAPARRSPSYDELTIRPAQLARPPLPPGAPVDTTAVLGATAARPLTLAMPLLVSPAGTSEISPEAQLALARGAAEAGTAVSSGGWAGSPQSGPHILHVRPGYPVRESALAAADAVEIRIGEAARPGLLAADLDGGVVYAPRLGGADLVAFIAEVRERTGGVPVGAKVTPGDVETDLAAAADAGLDFLTLGADTHLGVPSMPALARARAWLDREAVPGIDLVAAGGVRTPVEMTAALALGADLVALGTASLIAIGCQQYQACSSGACPVGIATQRAELRLRFNADLSAHRLTTFLRAATDTIAEYCRTAGRRATRDLCRDDLTALTPEAAAVTGLPYLG